MLKRDSDELKKPAILISAPLEQYSSRVPTGSSCFSDIKWLIMLFVMGSSFGLGIWGGGGGGSPGGDWTSKILTTDLPKHRFFTFGDSQITVFLVKPSPWAAVSVFVFVFFSLSIRDKHDKPVECKTNIYDTPRRLCLDIHLLQISKVE